MEAAAEWRNANGGAALGSSQVRRLTALAVAICRILIEPFATREEALAAEEFAIRTELARVSAA